jgi:hypothetical protein
MKKIGLLFLIIFLTSSIYSQTDTLSHKQYIDEHLKHLDKSKIPSNILMDRVLNLSSLKGYNNAATDTTHIGRLLSGYLELYNAAYVTEDITTIEK